MCGIAGNISIGNRKINNLSAVKQMLDVQNHRGPDDRGICCFQFRENVFIDGLSSDSKNQAFDGIIGFNRLSIRDLTEKGHQPMISLDKKVMLAFNGEIYNANEYRELLIKNGYTFRGYSDTEVILNMYIEYGFDKMIGLLNGMFAMVLVDIYRGCVYIARDRFGIKPMYYTVLNGKILFASEMKCFLCDEEFVPQIDCATIPEHIIYSGTNSKNLMKDVEVVRPGEVIKYEYGHEIKKYLFFNIDSYKRPMKPQKSYKEYKNEMEQLLKEAVGSQMVSDVKVGCQLSGGIDSTLITKYASEIDNSQLKDTISVIFDDTNKSYSEEIYMDMAQNVLDLDSHKFVIDRSYVGDNLERTIWHLDTMANTSNSIGIMLLSEKAKQYVTVLLSGEGADEAFAGYWQYSLAPVLKKYWEIRNAPIAGALLTPIARFDNGELNRHMRGGYANYVVSTFGVMEKDIFTNLMLYKEQSDAENVYENELRRRKSLFESFTGSEFDKHVKYMMTTNLPDLLIRQDKMSMSASIENRVPFLDNNVIDFSFSLPEAELIKWKISPSRIRRFKLTEGKYILKDIACTHFGDEFAYRGKRGFDLPLADFLSSTNFADFFNDELVPGMKNHGIINYQYASELYRNIEHISGKEAHALWKMINLEIWERLFIDKKGVTSFGA